MIHTSKFQTCIYLFRDMSTENLAYLSSEQALADLATFKTSMVDVLDTFKSKWITFGGSYPG